MPETNGYDAEELDRYLGAIEREHDELDRLKSEHMTACKGPRSRIKDTMAAAREAEVNMPAFRAVVKKRLAERAQEKRVAELEADDADAYSLMLTALGDFGDTELGEAALKKARPRKKGGDDKTLSSLS